MFLYCACSNCISIVFCCRLIMHKARVVLLCVTDYIYIKAFVQNKAQLCASSACISSYVLSDKEQN